MFAVVRRNLCIMREAGNRWKWILLCDYGEIWRIGCKVNCKTQDFCITTLLLRIFLVGWLAGFEVDISCTEDFTENVGGDDNL